MGVFLLFFHYFFAVMAIEYRSKRNLRRGSGDYSVFDRWLGVVFGVRHMTITHHDVVVAPFGGILLCIGSISLLSGRWGNMIKPSK